MAANPLLNAERIFPPGVSWANVVNAESAERRAGRGAAGRSRSRSRSRSARPSSGNLKTNQRGRVMIYTEQPAILASGERVRGHWFPAIDPEGDYSGPYHNLRQLLSDSRYRADMADIAKNQAAYSEYMAAQRGEAPAAAGRARSHSRSRGRGRSRSRSRGRGTRRNGRGGAAASRSRSRGRGRGRSRSRG